MKLARSQKGMSMLGWMLVLALVAFFASTAFKMFPHYMDYMALESMITKVETEPSLDISTVRDFYEHVEQDHIVTGKQIDGGPHKRWSMWFNSKQREEPYPALTC